MRTCDRGFVVIGAAKELIRHRPHGRHSGPLMPSDGESTKEFLEKEKGHTFSNDLISR
jgi:hypothetical protein